MIMEICQHVENRTTLALGTDLFLGYFPTSAPNDAVSLGENVPGHQEFGSEGMFSIPIQILARATVYLDARTLAMEVYNVLNGQSSSGFTLPVVESGPTYRLNAGQGSPPYYIGQDSVGRFEFSCNVTLKLQKIEV